MAAQLFHASVNGGLSGILAQLADGQQLFYDHNAKEKYPLEECPPITIQAPVPLDRVTYILEQMREAKVVHLR